MFGHTQNTCHPPVRKFYIPAEFDWLSTVRCSFWALSAVSRPADVWESSQPAAQMTQAAPGLPAAFKQAALVRTHKVLPLHQQTPFYCFITENIRVNLIFKIWSKQKRDLESRFWRDICLLKLTPVYILPPVRTSCARLPSWNDTAVNYHVHGYLSIIAELIVCSDMYIISLW